MRSLALVAVLLTSTATHALGQSRADEVRAIAAHVQATHPEGPRLSQNADWRAAVEALADRADGMDQDLYVGDVLRLLRRLNDGHTSVFIPGYREGSFGLSLPLAGRAFDDGYYITAAGPEGQALLGARVQSINGVPMDEVMRRFAGMVPADNPAWVHALSKYMFMFMGGFEAMGVWTEGPLEIVGRRDGAEVRATLTPTEGFPEGLTPVESAPTPLARWREAAGGDNFIHVEDGVAVVRLFSMGDVEGAPFGQLRTAIIDRLAQPDVERVVIDLRDNNGGNNFLAEPLRRWLISSRFNRRGGIFVLIGPETFSAAQNFATRLERETYAVFVGEPTGGRPNHFGDAERFTGPATGIPVDVSTRRWQDMPPMDQRVWILPDLPVPATFADWSAGRDPALDAAMSAPAPDVGLRHTVMPWERPSQQSVWQPFWRRD